MANQLCSKKNIFQTEKIFLELHQADLPKY